MATPPATTQPDTHPNRPRRHMRLAWVLCGLAICLAIVLNGVYLWSKVDSKNAPAQVLAAFGATARDETDLERLTAELLRVVDETMQPEFVGRWLKEQS